jgi:hypothetical protein
VIKDLPGRSNSVELRFTFKQSKTRAYKKPSVHSKYLSLTICEADDALCDIDMGGVEIFGNNFTYKLDKNWRVSGGTGNTNIVINVKLTPFGSAKTIKQ